MSQTLEPITSTISLDFGSAGIRLTPKEFDAIEQYDEKYRYELIRGVLVVNPIPNEGHRDPNEELGYLLRRYQEDHPQGSCLDATLYEEYIHLENSRRIADRVIWTGLGRLPDTRVDVPSIAVEFVSASRRDHLRDYVEKRAEYLELGVKEYWVIDRFRRIMTVYRAGEQKPTVVSESETYTTSLLPGFELPLAKVISKANRW